MSRQPTQIIPATPTSDGAGVRLFRSLGTRALPMLDPFLMLDEFRSDDPGDYIAGFPAHPHRGFETVTYMLAGAMRHEDSVGNMGDLGPGSVQWMTAGRGIIHSEMPRQQDGLMWGFQLWVNLPAAKKMITPRYQDIPPADIPEVRDNGAFARVIAGAYGGVEGPVKDIVTRPLMLDVTVDGEVTIPIPEEHNAFAYIFEGIVAFGGGESTGRGHLVVLGGGASLTARAEGGRFLLLAGEPIGEPVARYGPFVMNTKAEIQQAFEDYQSGRLAT